MTPSTSHAIEQIISSVKWLTPEEFFQGPARDLPGLWRALLSTDGATTTFLRALCAHPITVEVANQEVMPHPPSLSGWIDITKSSQWLSRRVWLKQGNRRLALGFSLIALDHLTEEVRSRLLHLDRPIGLLPGELGLPSRRDHFQIGTLASPPEWIRFTDGTPTSPTTPETTLWCRRYRLETPDSFTAAIIEIFSPALADDVAP